MHLAAIASAPRPAGGEAERRAREYCAGVLRAMGCEVAEHPFEYSAFPGRWGTPAFGAAVVVIMIVAAREGRAGHGARALAALLIGTVILSACGGWLGRRGVLDLPFARTRSTNLVATRGAPTLWLVAHLDSKSQPIPIGVRAIAIISCIVLLGAAIGVSVAQMVASPPPLVWSALTVAVLLAALPVMASVVGARSPGALDDASGVASVLRTVEMLPRDAAVGVLLTSAEELGLAGARAWARGAPPANGINIDGVDDVGAVRLIYSGRSPRELQARLGVSWPAANRLVPGVLMDGVALSDAGWEIVNISKGGWRTVSRIHTPSDDLAHLDGSGVEELARLLATSLMAPLPLTRERLV